MSLDTVVQDVLWNFDTLAEITNHQTLSVSGDRLSFDDRYFQGLRRAVSGDSRTHVLNVIRKTFKVADEVIHSYQCNYYLNPVSHHIHQEQVDIIKTILIHIQDLLDRKTPVITGLQTLATFERYVHDAGFQIEIKRFIRVAEQLHERCTQLKTLIEGRLSKLSNDETCCFSLPISVVREENEEDE